MVGGIGAFALILGPALLLQRRRFGRVRPNRLVGVAVICVYTMSLAGLTVAPAYEIAATCRNRAGGKSAPRSLQLGDDSLLQPHDSGVSILGLALSFPALQLLSNVVLFVPLGMVLRGVFRLNTTTSLAIGVMLSVLIEATQYTGAWGLYPCGVRIADIDDVFANSLGALLGGAGRADAHQVAGAAVRARAAAGSCGRRGIGRRSRRRGGRRRDCRLRGSDVDLIPQTRGLRASAPRISQFTVRVSVIVTSTLWVRIPTSRSRRAKSSAITARFALSVRPSNIEISMIGKSDPRSSGWMKSSGFSAMKRWKRFSAG